MTMAKFNRDSELTSLASVILLSRRWIEVDLCLMTGMSDVFSAGQRSSVGYLIGRDHLEALGLIPYPFAGSSITSRVSYL